MIVKAKVISGEKDFDSDEMRLKDFAGFLPLLVVCNVVYSIKAQDILGCGGFVKSSSPSSLDVTKIKVLLSYVHSFTH